MYFFHDCSCLKQIIFSLNNNVLLSIFCNKKYSLDNFCWFNATRIRIIIRIRVRKAPKDADPYGSG